MKVCKRQQKGVWHDIMERAQRERYGGGMKMCKEQLKKRKNPLSFGREQKTRMIERYTKYRKEN